MTAPKEHQSTKDHASGPKKEHHSTNRTSLEFLTATSLVSTSSSLLPYFFLVCIVDPQAQVGGHQLAG